MIDTFGPLPLHPGRARFGAAGFLVNAFHQALLDGRLDRDGVHRPAERIVSLFGISQQFVEKAADAAMRRNNGKRPAPLDDRLGHRIKSALILVQCKFVELHMPALANNRIRVGRERINAGTSGKG